MPIIRELTSTFQFCLMRVNPKHEYEKDSDLDHGGVVLRVNEETVNMKE